MYFLLVFALLCTFIYINLTVVDIINTRAYSANDQEQAVFISKIKYVLLILMAFSWGAVIRFW